MMAGVFIGIATSYSVVDWYPTLNRPSWNPPNWLFGPVWTILYFMMGWAFARIWSIPTTEENKDNQLWAYRLYIVQLLLNFAWSFIFFYFHQIGWALFEIVLMWISIAACIWSFHKLDRFAAGLMLPYLVWVSFATVLNFAFWWLN